MRKNFITIAIALLFCTVAIAENQRVAVFDPAGNAERHINEIVREIFSSVIVNTDGYVVLERSLIDRVLAENLFQAEGLVDDAQISEMGRMMGANLAFVTSLTRMGDGNFFISARLIDVMTARIEKQQTARTSRATETELITTAERLAGEMFAQTTMSTAQPQRTIRQPTVQNEAVISDEAQRTNNPILTRGRNAIGGNLFAVGADGVFSFGIGAKYQYSVTDPIRLEGSFSYFFPEHHSQGSLSMSFNWREFNVNVHYLFSLSDKVVLYPLAGLNIGMWNFEAGNFGEWSESESGTVFGFNLGAGIDFQISKTLTLNVESRYNIRFEGWGNLFFTRVGLTYNF